jgi:DNA-directed RNA polymerase beta subunit
MQKTLKMAINYNEKKVFTPSFSSFRGGRELGIFSRPSISSSQNRKKKINRNVIFSTRVNETINVSTSCTIKTKGSSNLQLWKINKERKKMEENSSNNLDKYISIEYPLESYHRSNQDTCLVHKPSVFEGQWVESGDLLADCSASVGGELSLGQNILIGYMPWEGYNFEDAILISERLVYDDLYTSIHIERYEVTVEETKLGIEEITREIPEVQEKSLRHLNSLGIAKIGSWIEEGDILIGKVTPINKKNQSNYQKLLYLILDKTISPVCDSSLRAPKGIKAKVIGIQLFKKNQNNSLAVPLSSHHEISRKENKQNEKKRYPVLQSLKTSSIPLSNINRKNIKDALPPTKNQKSIFKNKKNKFTNPPILPRMGKLETYSELSNKNSQHEINRINDSQLSNLDSNNKKQQLESFSYSDTNLFLSPSISPPVLHFLPIPHFPFFPLWGKKHTPFRGEREEAQPKDEGGLLCNVKGNGERKLNRGKEKNEFFTLSHLKTNISNEYYNKFIKKNIRTNFLQSKKKFYNYNKDLLPNKKSSHLPLVTKRNNFREGKKEKNQKTLVKNISSIQIYLAERRRVQVGDKMAGRHGNKGIISEILPIEDLPYLPDGTPLDMVLNPLGVPSRMNVGQIYECLLGLAGKHLGENFKIFPFDESYGAEASRSFVYSKLYNASVKTGKTWLFNPNFPGKLCLYDGRTGDSFHQAITVGYAYILRLVHMVDDKMHCLTPDHDVLTTKGWIGIDKITCKDKIATLQKNGQLVYQKPTNIFHYKNYKGSLYHIKNNTIDLMVTPNHRMYVKKNLFPFSSKKQSLLENKKKETYELIEAKNLIGKNYKYLKKAKWIQQDYQFVLPSVQYNSLTTSRLIKRYNCDPSPITSLPLPVPCLRPFTREKGGPLKKSEAFFHKRGSSKRLGDRGSLTKKYSSFLQKRKFLKKGKAFFYRPLIFSPSSCPFSPFPFVKKSFAFFQGPPSPLGEGGRSTPLKREKRGKRYRGIGQGYGDADGDKSKMIGTNIIQEKKINMNAWLIFFGLWISRNNWFSLTNKELIINELCYSHSNMQNLDNSNNFIKKASKKKRSFFLQNNFFLLKLLKNILNQLGYKYKKINQKLYIKDYQLCLYLKKLTINFEKNFLPSWIWQLSQKQSQLLLSSIMLSSSLYKSKNYNFFNKFLLGFSRDKEKHPFKKHLLRSKSRNKTLFTYKPNSHFISNKKLKKKTRLTTKNFACFSTSKLKLTNNSLKLKYQNSSTNLYTPYFKLADEIMRLALHAGWDANKSISVTRSPCFFPFPIPLKGEKRGLLCKGKKPKDVAFFLFPPSLCEAHPSPLGEGEKGVLRRDIGGQGKGGKEKLGLDDFINNSQCINLCRISIIIKQNNLIFNNQVHCNKNHSKFALKQDSVVFSASSLCDKKPVISSLTDFIEKPRNLVIQTLNYSNSPLFLQQRGEGKTSKIELKKIFQQSFLGKQIEEFIPYIGSVFCLTVPNEVFYIRRNGYAVWTGNSRSTGPYSLVTQQPLRGRSKHGGQRLGEMEVWALEGYGAAFTLLEMLTIKSDDMSGRMTLWSNLILNKEISIGTPESFKVLICELQALCLDIGLFRMIPSKSKLGATPT